jgi:hypothetical protein
LSSMAMNCGWGHIDSDGLGTRYQKNRERCHPKRD